MAQEQEGVYTLDDLVGILPGAGLTNEEIDEVPAEEASRDNHL